MRDEWAKEYFEGRCPYTGKPCDDWECNKCETEKQEQRWIEEEEEE